MKRANTSQEILSVSDSKKMQEFEDLFVNLECCVCLDTPLTFDVKGIQSCSSAHI